MEALLESEHPLRLSVFASAFIAIAAWELVAPRRVQTQTRRQRWPGNLGILLVDAILLRLVLPGVTVGFSLLAESRGWGLLALSPMPSWLKIVTALLVLDLVVYLQHVLFHAVPVLWRLHRVHHTDLDVDVTTGIRFHPAEVLLSTLIKCTAIAAFGPPVIAVLVSETLLSTTSVFNHGNVRIPIGLDRVLRCIVVTPDMHRVHHSIVRNETNSNFGFNFPWWDRWFGTYRAQPAAGHTNMTIGIEEFREDDDARLGRLLLQPLRGTASTDALNRGREA